MTDKETPLSLEDHELSKSIQQLTPKSPETEGKNLSQKTHALVKNVLNKKNQPPNSRITKAHRSSKTRIIGTSEVIKRNWPKRKPQEEWYKNEFKYPPRRAWENAGDRSV